MSRSGMKAVLYPSSFDRICKAILYHLLKVTMKAQSMLMVSLNLFCDVIVVVQSVAHKCLARL